MRGFLSGLLVLAAAEIGVGPSAWPEASSAPVERVDFSAETELHWALGTHQGKSQQGELLFRPKAEVDLGRPGRLIAAGRVRVDAVDDLEPGRAEQDEISVLSRRALSGDRVELELREFYLETHIGRTYLTLGKQHIVWGKADGLKILDVVNPQSFREFILDEFEESRIPLWALNAEIPLGDWVAQVIWLPDPSYHDLPEPGGLYRFTSPRLVPEPPPGVPLDLRPVRRPRRLVADSDAGLRLSTFWRGWDLTLNYLYHYDDFPVLARSLFLGPLGPLLVVQPRYERTHLVGGTFSNAFGDLTVRGEVGYSTDRFVSTTDPADRDGLFRTGELQYVVAVDWYGFRETLISGQVFQVRLMSERTGSIRDPVETTLSLLVRREFWNDRLVADCIWLQNLDRSDGLVRPALRYEISDALEVRLGLDLFYGASDGLFGEFDRNDRVDISLIWSL